MVRHPVERREVNVDRQPGLPANRLAVGQVELVEPDLRAHLCEPLVAVLKRIGADQVSVDRLDTCRFIDRDVEGVHKARRSRMRQCI